jgi:hypothetical protein
MRGFIAISVPVLVALAMLTARSQTESLERPQKATWERLVDDAHAAFDRNHDDEANQFLERAWAMVRNAEPGPDLLKSAVVRITLAYDYGEYTANAEQVYREGIALAAGDPRTRIELLAGLCGRLSGWQRIVAAEACLADAHAASTKELGDTDPQTLDLDESLIHEYERAGEYHKADAEYRRILTREEIRPAIYSSAAIFYSVYGGKEQFEAACSKAAAAGISVSACPNIEEPAPAQIDAQMGEMNSMQEIIDPPANTSEDDCAMEPAFRTASESFLNGLVDRTPDMNSTIASLGFAVANGTSRCRHETHVGQLMQLAWNARVSGRPSLADKVAQIAEQSGRLTAASEIASYYSATRQPEKAQAFVRTALARAHQLQGQDSPVIASLLATNLSVAKQRSDAAAVEQSANDLNAFNLRVHGPNSQETMMSLLEIADTQAAVGNASAAESAISAALGTCQSISATPTYRYAEALDYAARVFVILGKLDDAAAYNRRARDIAESRAQITTLFDATKQYIDNARASAPLTHR